MAGDTANIWENFEIRLDPDPFFHIMPDFFHEQKIYRYKNPLNPKAPFKWL